MEVAIVKYNAGNIYSVVNALRRMGIEPLLTDDAEQLQKADRVLFPGQGHAAEAMEYLKARRLDEVIRDLKQPVFGICVGQQLLCIKRFQPEKHEDKVPCMGWNKLSLPQPLQKEGRVDPLMEGLLSPLPLEGTGEAAPYVYFVHSYYVPLCEETIAVADYILPYSASMHKDNFYTCQFHPEKSGKVGERIIKNFLEL